MRINVKDEFPFPAEVVFLTFRDRMEEYVKYTPNITGIKIKEREEVDEKTTKIQADWAGMGQIPAAVRNILKPEMLSWEDWQTWDSEAMTNTWIIKPYYFREFVTCNGKWEYIPKDDDKTIVKCTGVFEVKITHFPPFPDFLCRKMSPLIEKMIGGFIPANMKDTFKAIKKFIAADMKKK
ncbi:hypothetical protein ACFLQK_01480 [bacterium]